MELCFRYSSSSTQQYKRCQLRVDFDRKSFSERLSWKGDDCEELIMPPAQMVVSQPVAPLIETPTVESSIDILFEFDRSDAASIVEGRIRFAPLQIGSTKSVGRVLLLCLVIQTA
jgi:hypothetical protein